MKMARQKEYAHLLKPLVVKNGPAGLYPEPRVWAEGRDWEGFDGNFSYGFFKWVDNTYAFIIFDCGGIHTAPRLDPEDF
jgi:hypothetical protein